VGLIHQRFKNGSFPIDALGFAAIILLFGPGLLHFFTVSFSPDYANDDSRQYTWPLLRSGDPSLFVRDPIADYFLNTLFPLGYRVLMQGLASVVDAVPLATAVGHFCLGMALLFAFLTGRFLGGPAGGWVCVALILGDGKLLALTAGGLPRATGIAISFMSLYGFLCGRRFFTGLSVLLGALFWYPVALSAGLLFAIQCLAPPAAFFFSDSTSPIRRVGAVLTVALLALALLAPKALLESEWGVVISNDSSAWPEAGIGGRFARGDQLGLGEEPGAQIMRVLRAYHGPHPWLDTPEAFRDSLAFAIASLQFLVLLLLAPTRPIARRLLSVGAVSVSLYVLAMALAPMLYVPSRFLLVLIPWLNILAFVYLVSEGGSWLSGKAHWINQNSMQLILAGLALLVLGGRPYEEGYYVKIGASQRQALNFISELPKTALMGGWPTGIMNNIPLFSRRRVLLSGETHLAFHEGYVRDMRLKAEALIDAWFSTNSEALQSLRDRYGVTHFVVEKKRRAKERLSYFSPFDQYIALKRSALANKKRWIDAPSAQSIVFENDGFIIIDLARVNHSKGAASLDESYRKCV
jgi:hypothetical protein